MCLAEDEESSLTSAHEFLFSLLGQKLFFAIFYSEIVLIPRSIEKACHSMTGFFYFKHHSTTVAFEKSIDVTNTLPFTIVIGTRYVILPFLLYFVISKTANIVPSAFS